MMFLHVLVGGSSLVGSRSIDTALFGKVDPQAIGYHKEISLGMELGPFGVVFPDMLKVRFDRTLSEDPYWSTTFWEFYFTRELGLVAVRFNPHLHSPIVTFQLATRHDTLPLPMTR
jgi:hypothetical protein